MIQLLLPATAHLPVALRAALAVLTAALLCIALGPTVIAWLRRLGAREATEKTPIEDEALRRSISAKSGTPTMGGVLLLAGLLGACVLWGDLSDPAVPAVLVCALALGAFGVLDDHLKLRGLGYTDRGLKVRHKLFLQGVVGAGLGAFALWKLHAPSDGRLFADVAQSFAVPGAATATVFVGWSALILATMSNATNVTDGLDGLLAGLAPIAAGVLGFGCWASGNAELAVVCAALGGACLGFLWFNRYPAKVFMGDTGSMAIGAALAAVAIAAGQELLLILVGAVFLAEFGSSLLQIGFYKLFRRRILPIAPLHHIFQKRGVAEARIVRGFYVCGGIAALVALNWLRLRTG